MKREASGSGCPDLHVGRKPLKLDLTLRKKLTVSFLGPERWRVRDLALGRKEGLVNI